METADGKKKQRSWKYAGRMHYLETMTVNPSEPVWGNGCEKWRCTNRSEAWQKMTDGGYREVCTDHYNINPQVNDNPA